MRLRQLRTSNESRFGKGLFVESARGLLPTTHTYIVLYIVARMMYGDDRSPEILVCWQQDPPIHKNNIEWDNYMMPA